MAEFLCHLKHFTEDMGLVHFLFVVTLHMTWEFAFCGYARLLPWHLQVLHAHFCSCPFNFMRLLSCPIMFAQFHVVSLIIPHVYLSMSIQFHLCSLLPIYVHFKTIKRDHLEHTQLVGQLRMVGFLLFNDLWVTDLHHQDCPAQMRATADCNVESEQRNLFKGFHLPNVPFSMTYCCWQDHMCGRIRSVNHPVLAHSSILRPWYMSP